MCYPREPLPWDLLKNSAQSYTPTHVRCHQGVTRIGPAANLSSETRVGRGFEQSRLGGLTDWPALNTINPTYIITLTQTKEDPASFADRVPCAGKLTIRRFSFLNVSTFPTGTPLRRNALRRSFIGDQHLDSDPIPLYFGPRLASPAV